MLQTSWTLVNKYLDPSNIRGAPSSTGRWVPVWASLGKIVSPFPLRKRLPEYSLQPQPCVTIRIMKITKCQRLFQSRGVTGGGETTAPWLRMFGWICWTHRVGCLPCFLLQCPGKQTELSPLHRWGKCSKMQNGWSASLFCIWTSFYKEKGVCTSHMLHSQQGQWGSELSPEPNSSSSVAWGSHSKLRVLCRKLKVTRTLCLTSSHPPR